MKEQFLEKLDSSLQSGEDIAIASDFDKTISIAGFNNGLDVRDNYLDPNGREAFEGIISSGRDVVIISARGGQNIAELIDIEGIAVIGTLGLEALDSSGKSHINSRLNTFRPQITSILREVKQRFLFKQLGLTFDIENQSNVELPTPSGGRVIFQPKGYNDLYPQGINHAYSMHLAPVEEGEKFIEALEDYHRGAFDRQVKDLDDKGVAELSKLSVFMKYREVLLTGDIALDAEIRPAKQGSKRGAMLQLMREPGDPKRKPHFKDMPYHKFWIYSGDHAIQDGSVMRFLRLSEVLTKGQRGGLGIWSKPLSEEYRVIKGADVVVDSVSGNVALFKDIAKLMRKYPVCR